MKISKIHSMKWGNPEHTIVGLVADTDEGDNLEIGTPYDETSIIWEAVKAFPVEQIAEYVEPVIVEESEEPNNQGGI